MNPWQKVSIGFGNSGDVIPRHLSVVIRFIHGVLMTSLPKKNSIFLFLLKVNGVVFSVEGLVSLDVRTFTARFSLCSHQIRKHIRIILTQWTVAIYFYVLKVALRLRLCSDQSWNQWSTGNVWIFCCKYNKWNHFRDFTSVTEYETNRHKNEDMQFLVNKKLQILPTYCPDMHKILLNYLFGFWALFQS